MHQDVAILLCANTTQLINCPSVIRCMQLVNALFLKFLPTHVWLKDAAEILNSKDTFLLFLLQTNNSTSAGSSVTQISSKTYKSISHSAVVYFRSTGCFFWSFVAERDRHSTDRESRKTSHRQFGYCWTIWCPACLWILETLPPKLQCFLIISAIIWTEEEKGSRRQIFHTHLTLSTWNLLYLSL